MPKRELTKTEKGVLLGFFGALGAFFGIRELLKAAPPEPEPKLATLWGIVTGADTGKPIEGIEVSLDSWVLFTPSNGRYEFANVEPGTYNLRFFDPMGRYETLVYEGGVTLVEGTRQLNIALSLKPVSPGPQPQEPPWDAKSRLCPYCGLVFASYDILLDHIHIVHPGYPDPEEVPMFS